MQPITLGELIDTISCFPHDLPVRYPLGYVGRPVSWRGSYDELTLPPDYGSTGIETVNHLVSALKVADGATYTGYKGGDFTMNRSTPVWADGWGECPGNAIVGVCIRHRMWTPKPHQFVNETHVELVAIRVGY